MPQISFQVNVATVEYKHKKPGFNGSYSTIDMPPVASFQTSGFMGGSTMMKNSAMIGGGGNDNDRGDEINLDEL
jgi:hypothetical protein